MKLLDSYLLLLLLTVLPVNYAFCQQAPLTPEERAQKQTEWMKQNLELSDAQVTRVSAINLKYANQAEDIIQKNGSGTDREAIHEQMKTLQASKDEELRTVLTPDQFKTYEIKRSEMRGRPHM